MYVFEATIITESFNESIRNVNLDARDAEAQLSVIKFSFCCCCASVVNWIPSSHGISSCAQLRLMHYNKTINELKMKKESINIFKESPHQPLAEIKVDKYHFLSKLLFVWVHSTFNIRMVLIGATIDINWVHFPKFNTFV